MSQSKSQLVGDKIYLFRVHVGRFQSRGRRWRQNCTAVQTVMLTVVLCIEAAPLLSAVNCHSGSHPHKPREGPAP